MAVLHRASRFALVLFVGVAVFVPALSAIGVRAAGTTYYVGQLFPDDTGMNLTPCFSASNTTCTLRDALGDAQSGMDTIQFTPNASLGVYTLGTGGGQGTLVLYHSVTITGPGSGQLTIDGGLNAGMGTTGTRVFLVNSGVTATISGLEIAHGNVSDFGGAIANYGALTLSNDKLDHNNATEGGGAVSTSGTNASLIVTGSTLSNNTTSGTNGNGGGAIDVLAGTASLTDSTVTANNANGGAGGGILSSGSQLTLTRVQVTNNSAGTLMNGNNGGGISTSGAATITDSTITGNTAINAGGGVFGGPLTISGGTVGTNTAGTTGGGIATGSSALFTNVTVTGNTATGDGGGISAISATITGGTIGSNTAGGNGGGVAATGLTTKNVTISGNAAGSTSMGGGIFIGGAANASLNDTGSAITGNRAPAGGQFIGEGGGIYLQQGMFSLTSDSVTNNTAGTSMMRGNGGGFYVASGNGTISGATFTNNAGGQTGCGGALEADAGTLAITDTLFSGNHIDTGFPCAGAIAVEGASMTVTNSAFTGNAVTITSGGGGNGGGAIAIDSGALTVTGSTFTNNSVTYSPMTFTFPSGGGALELNGGTTTIANSTFASNAAIASPGTTAVGGGAVIAFPHATATLANDTVSGNTAPFAGGIRLANTAATLTDTIVSGSTDGAGHAVTDLAGAFVAASRNNLIGAVDNATTGIANGVNGNQVGTLAAPVNAHLGPLGDNGGGTLPGGGHPRTFALLPSSPAIDAGGVCAADPTTNQPLVIDQRGAVRPQGNACDIGAYEYTPVRPTVTGSYRAGAAGQQLRLVGTGFQHGSVAVVDGVSQPASAITNVADDGTALVVSLPAHAAGVVTLAVTNPGALTSTATGNLTYATPNAQPAPEPTAPVTGKPQPPMFHPNGAVGGVGTPTPLPQPTRH